MTLDDWKISAQTFEFDGHSISFHDSARPQKPAILFLHGFPTSSWDWHHLWQAFDADYRLITLDLLGYGLSDKPKSHRYSIEQQTNIVDHLLSALDVSAVHIAAHDIGVNVAQELLARDQRKCSRLSLLSVMFLNGALFPDSQKPTALQSVMSSKYGFLFSWFVTRRMFEKQLLEIFGDAYKPNEVDLDNVWELVSFKQGHKLSHKLMSYIHDRVQSGIRWSDAIAYSAVPMLMINGDQDPIIGTRMLQRFRVFRGKSAGIGLEDVGHYPHIEKPNEVIVLYKRFLRTLNDKEQQSNTDSSL